MDVIEPSDVTHAKSEIERLNRELQRFKERPSGKPFILKYGVALLSVVTGLILTLWMRAELGRESTPIVAVFLCAVMFSGWFAGFKPGLFALALSVLAFEYFFVPPFYSLAPGLNEIPRLIIFTLSGLFVLSLTAAQSTAAESLRRARDMLEETVQGLRRSNQALRKENVDRTSAEEQLKKEKEALEKIFTNIPAMVAFTGPDGTPKLVNPEWERRIGWTLTEMQEQKVDIYAEAYPDPHYREKVLSFVAAATGEWVDLRVRVRDGGLIDIACAVVLLSDGTRVAIAQDITERKQAEEALRQSEDRLRLVIDTIPIEAWSVQADGSVDFVNQRWFDYTGLNWEQYLQDPNRIVHPKDKTRVVEKWLADMAAGAPYETEMRLQRADGEYRWFLVRIAPLRDKQGNVIKWYGVSTDIEELKRAEGRIKATSEQLRALSARLHSAKEEEDIRIAREIHDELGSVLTSLRWELEQHKKTIAEAEDWSHRQPLRTTIDGMIRLTDMAINTTRRIAAELRPSLLDDLGLVDALEWQLEQFQERTSVSCHFDCTVSHLTFDRDQSTAIFRIFQEALTNIRRHARATAVEVVMREERGEVVLTISDNGKGITENDRSGTHSLGILGMRERAHLIGAELGIIGSEGKGTTVTVRMPIAGNANS